MLEGVLLANKYRLIERLGEGAMGMVWLAKNEDTDRYVAIKHLTSFDGDQTDARERFRREARACGRIDHRNVVEVIDVFDQNGTDFMVMELLRGQTLDALLTRVGALDVETACAIARAVSSGVEGAHRRRILHRDLKPANVYLHQQEGAPIPLVKVADFGLSRIGSRSDLTATGHIMGTPSYMSPEQVRGFALTDARTDIWSIGVILYRMLTGELPFHGETPYETMDAVIHADAPDPSVLVPKLPQAVSDVVMRCLKKDPAERFQTCEGIVEALDAALPGLKDGLSTGSLRTLAVDLEPMRYSSLPREGVHDDAYSRPAGGEGVDAGAAVASKPAPVPVVTPGPTRILVPASAPAGASPLDSTLIVKHRGGSAAKIGLFVAAALAAVGLIGVAIKKQAAPVPELGASQLATAPSPDAPRSPGTLVAAPAMPTASSVPSVAPASSEAPLPRGSTARAPSGIPPQTHATKPALRPSSQRNPVVPTGYAESAD